MMYRIVLKILQNSRRARAVCAFMMIVHLQLTTVFCLSHHVAYHVVTPTHTHQSTSRDDVTDYDINAVTSDFPDSTPSSYNDLTSASSTENSPTFRFSQSESFQSDSFQSSRHYKHISRDGSSPKSPSVIFSSELKSALRTDRDFKARTLSFDLRSVDSIFDSTKSNNGRVTIPCCPWWDKILTQFAQAKEGISNTKPDVTAASKLGRNQSPESDTDREKASQTISSPELRHSHQSDRVGKDTSRSGPEDIRTSQEGHSSKNSLQASESLASVEPLSNFSEGKEKQEYLLTHSYSEGAPVQEQRSDSIHSQPRESVRLVGQFNPGGLGTLDFHRSELSVSSVVSDEQVTPFPVDRNFGVPDRVSVDGNSQPLRNSENRQKRDAPWPSGDVVLDEVTAKGTSADDVSLQNDDVTTHPVSKTGAENRFTQKFENSGTEESSSSKDAAEGSSTESLPIVDTVVKASVIDSSNNNPHTASAEIKYNKRAVSSGTTCDPSLSAPSSAADGGLAVKIGVILPFKGPFHWVLHKTHPALVLAVERVEREGLLPNKSVELVLRDSYCSETYGPLQGIDLYVEKAANVFVGPACDYAVAPLARFSFRWQIPILTAGALVSAFQDRREYRLLTRVQGAYAKAGEFVHSVFENFGWKWAGLVYHDVKDSPNHGRSNCYFMVEAIFLTLRNAYGVEPWHRQFDGLKTTPEGYAEYLRDVSRAARVVVLCASPNSVREIMIKAHELNFDNGEYVFFNIDLFSSKNDSRKPWYREGESEERNNKARKAYEALMTVTLRKPTSPEYRAFSNDVKQRARTMYPNFTYGEEEVNSFVGAFHDAVLLYALALNETLEANGSISDGAAITQRMWNRTFEGITGNVSIDSNGDRNADYSLLDLNPETGQFEVVANYYGNKKRYEPVPDKSIHWAGGRTDAPPDTPRCGFDGSKCPPEEPFPEYGIVIIVLGSILLIVIIAVVVIYRHIKLEAELAEMNWRVRWEDILFGSPEKNKKLERQGSKLSLVKGSYETMLQLTRGSCPSSVSGDTLAFQLSDAGNRQLFTKTGYYKGAIIAIKSILRTNITVSKPLLLEIKRMKDLQNDHIVRFLGACIDYPNQCLLTEYCPKGSLQDVLENDQIKLDWMFRYSIMQDIVRGMAYLQGTDIRSHGNLKSTNCVVDSRFVVKITDFGLHYFRHNPDFTEDDNDYSSFHNKLWTAPELLRMQCRPAEGTAKGDVYSFAIISQEIVYRNGVFYLSNLDLTPQEIYGKVRNGLKPYFRPTLEEYDCPCDELATVIRRCWAEDPSDRPDFTQLKTIIRKLNRDGDKGNILDNLLSRMEQYANNLEALVEERTADYLQQKKKAEDLLYNMLPRSVALQLIRGESVTAESYDNVSIYFSDICGFTAMSAESTPMQVVDLLNDLYTTFDSIIENFDVYKVETIGDAYMVVSGLPEKNGDLHAREIARMSLMLLEAVLSFRVRHRPKEQLKLRIGIHSGPVCSGVVGHKMPRYCLFGDTVNTASRMESNGLPLRIHVSHTTKQVLDSFGCFELESRGEVEMKVRAAHRTDKLNTIIQQVKAQCTRGGYLESGHYKKVLEAELLSTSYNAANQ